MTRHSLSHAWFYLFNRPQNEIVQERILQLILNFRRAIPRILYGVFFVKNMIISRCHKNSVYVELDYYVCSECGLPCDTVFPFSFNNDSIENDLMKLKRKDVEDAKI